MTTTEVALGLSASVLENFTPAKISAWCRWGKLRATKVNGKWDILEDDFDRLLTRYLSGESKVHRIIKHYKVC